MITLNLRKNPYWIDLPDGVRVFVKPVTTAIMNAAQTEVIKHYHESDIKPDDGQLQCDLTKALARRAITKWENVIIPNTGKPAEANEKNINQLMNVWYLAQDFWNKYATNIFEVEAEGKSSEPCVNGTSPVDKNTVVAVKRKGSTAKRSVRM